ncbi:MAG: ABC transporter ATP-binding protein [Clostridia bacterium]|nr:ABC transporter ATP-binding protein [Clostridia bacterium]MBQ6718325.1 ABC transporter ATP-binding protein [Clostridia bacterium]
MKDYKPQHNTFSNVWFAFKCHFKAAPCYTVFTLLQTILGDLITLFEHVFLPAHIISCVEKKSPISEVLVFLIPIALAVILKVGLTHIVGNYIAPKSLAKINKYIHLNLYEKAVSMDIAKYDDSKYYNDYVWAMEYSTWHLDQAVNQSRQFISNIVVALVSGSYVVSVDIRALIALLIVAAINLTANIILNKIDMKQWEELMPIWRKRNYSNRVFYLSYFVKDLRMGKMNERLEKDFSECRDVINSTTDRYFKKFLPFELLNYPLHDIVLKGVYLSYLFYQAFVNKLYGFGMLYGIYNAVRNINDKIINSMRIFPELQWDSKNIDKIRVFLDAKNEILDDGTSKISSSGDIELENVHFTYPGNDTPTINGISMKINQGEKIALVGFNGAGKSTLIKLILRLYDVNSGVVKFDGRPIADYPLQKYRGVFSTLFQDFQTIAATIAQNITMDNSELDVDKAHNSLEMAAFKQKFDTLPKGFETQLTKEFDDNGVNLSGGEAQKLAVARVLYANKNIIILDEPSSALDPLAEYQLNKTVTELAGEKTVIIISHRLSTTRFVDKIYMLENGQIVESGNHDVLLKQNGKYSKMFKLQAEKYR